MFVFLVEYVTQNISSTSYKLSFAPQHDSLCYKRYMDKLFNNQFTEPGLNFLPTIHLHLKSKCVNLGNHCLQCVMCIGKRNRTIIPSTKSTVFDLILTSWDLWDKEQSYWNILSILRDWGLFGKSTLDHSLKKLRYDITCSLFFTNFPLELKYDATCSDWIPSSINTMWLVIKLWYSNLDGFYSTNVGDHIETWGCLVFGSK